MQQKRFILLSYGLALVGYMTLTITLPIVAIIGLQDPAIKTTILSGMAVLFFAFSLSAIVLSRIADFIGPYKVLLVAQLISIIGLFTLSFSHSPWTVYAGFLLMGAGTGCYSSIARLIISTKSTDKAQLRKAFSIFSFAVVIAPFVSSQIAVHAALYNWRVAYWIMAGIEIALLLTVNLVLKHENPRPRKMSLFLLIDGYIYCLKQPIFRLNMLIACIIIATFMKLFMGSSHQFCMLYLKMSAQNYSLFAAGLTTCYIMGVLAFRYSLQLVDINKARWFQTILLLICGIAFMASHVHVVMIASVLVACFSLGYHVPLSTSSGIAVIDQHVGAAAALYPFTFSIISCGLSIIEYMIPNVGVVDFMGFSWVCFSLLMLFFIYLLRRVTVH